MNKEKPKLVKLTDKQIREKKLQLANMEFEMDLVKIKIEHFKKRMSNGIIELEKEAQLETMKEQLKLSKATDPKKATQNALKQLEQVSNVTERNIKALKIQLKTGKQPDFTKININ